MAQRYRQASNRSTLPKRSTRPVSRKASLRGAQPTKRGLAFRKPLPTPTESDSDKDEEDESDTESEQRQPLAPVPPNLRRLPSRFLSAAVRNMKLGSFTNIIGGKRKRGENSNARPTAGRAKRRKRNSSSEPSSMDVDSSRSSGEEDAASDSSDDYMLLQAPPKQLGRLRKEELVRLYNVAELIGDAETMTKPEIVNAIISARDNDQIELPPSSPRAESSADDGEADDGNFAAGEETDHPQLKSSGLRRRATYTVQTDEHPAKRKCQNRSVSMGNLESAWNFRPNHEAALASCSSPPPAARTRSRKLSIPQQNTPKPPRAKVRMHIVGEESDLTELDDLDSNAPSSTRVQPSPRRTRSKSQVTLMEDDIAEEDENELDAMEDELGPLPSTPPRKPKQVERRTPVKSRLRPRRTQTFTPPSDGDDEAEAEAETDAEGEEADAEEDVDPDADEAEYDPTPRKLRSGRVVGEVDETLETDESDTSFVAPADADSDEEVEEETAEEGADVDDGMKDDLDDPTDFDLHNTTAKALIRLRRADLVFMCAARELSMAGTKAQLADSLIAWRDTVEAAPPNSTGTVREAPATARQPVLLRSHTHADGPCTPPPSPAEPEIELDLESLGLEDREIAPEKLTKLEKIGSGGFKDVFIGKLKGRKIAISEFRGTLSAMDIKELKLLGGFNHPNIVRFLGVSIPENTRETPVMMISELCSNGDLFDYVRNVAPPPLNKVLNIMTDIAKGIEYLHLMKPSVIHRDCKSSNILITSRGVAKIADFGLAKVKQSTRSMVRSLVGTVNWQAPELWHAHPKYNHKVDVWSCGMVYWEMLQWYEKEKKFPWEGMNEHAIYDAVGAKHQRPPTKGLRKLWGTEPVDLMERMWKQEHEDRPSMSEVVQSLKRIPRR